MSDEIQVEGEELPHLLLVDDDATFTRVMARAMSRRGFRVSTAGSAEEGLKIAQDDVPDYATLDLKMDGDSGLVLLPKLLELDPEMRVVILTGYSSIATAVEAIKRGACNYLCKPADADDVLAALLSEHADLDSLVPENPMSVDRLQWEHIQRVLTEHEGNISATARALGMHRRTLPRDESTCRRGSFDPPSLPAARPRARRQTPPCPSRPAWPGRSLRHRAAVPGGHP